MFKKLFGLVAALLFCTFAQAQIAPITSSEYQCNGRAWFPTAQAAGAEYNANGGPAGYWVGPFSYSFGYCQGFDPTWSTQVNMVGGNMRSTTSCPANSTLSGSFCVCNSGYTETGGACVNSQCEVGKGRTFNRTEGWARSSNANANDLVSEVAVFPSLYDYNDGVCVGNLTGVERCYRSQEPSAQGLYRVSCDYTMVVSGESTGGGDSRADPTTPDASCPGYVGEVNGKTVCVGTASNPLPSPSNAPNEPTSAGNPSAGGKPATGEGSGSSGAGRTPTAGSGGNAGGPASAAVGRGGTGDRGEPGEDGTGVCGAPPLPSCNVKVDETGTPAEGTAAGRFGQANSDVDSSQSDAEGFIRGIEDIVLPSWSWTFSFPTGCTPLVLPAFNNLEIDVCQWQPIIHDLMSVIWVIAGIWGFIGLFRNATGV